MRCRYFCVMFFITSLRFFVKSSGEAKTKSDHSGVGNTVLSTDAVECQFLNYSACVHTVKSTPPPVTDEESTNKSVNERWYANSLWYQPLNSNQPMKSRVWAASILHQSVSSAYEDLPKVPFMRDTEIKRSKKNRLLKDATKNETVNFKQAHFLPWQPFKIKGLPLLLVPLRHLVSEDITPPTQACLQFRLKASRDLNESDNIKLILVPENSSKMLFLWSKYGSGRRWTQYVIGLNKTSRFKLVFAGTVQVSTKHGGFLVPYQIYGIKITSCKSQNADYNSHGDYQVGASPASNFKCRWVKFSAPQVPEVSLELKVSEDATSDRFEVDTAFVSVTGAHVCVHKVSDNGVGWSHSGVQVSWVISKAPQPRMVTDSIDNSTVPTKRPSGNSTKPVCTGLYRCVGTKACIPHELLCNGFSDCPSGDDEMQSCGDATSFVFAVVSASSAAVFAVLFLYLYYVRIQLLDSDLYGENFDDETRRYVELLETAIENTTRWKRDSKLAEGTEYNDAVSEL